jgi:hypothetical protein
MVNNCWSDKSLQGSMLNFGLCRDQKTVRDDYSISKPRPFYPCVKVWFRKEKRKVQSRGAVEAKSDVGHISSNMAFFLTARPGA